MPKKNTVSNETTDPNFKSMRELTGGELIEISAGGGCRGCSKGKGNSITSELKDIKLSRQ